MDDLDRANRMFHDLMSSWREADFPGTPEIHLPPKAWREFEMRMLSSDQVTIPIKMLPQDKWRIDITGVAVRCLTTNY